MAMQVVQNHSIGVEDGFLSYSNDPPQPSGEADKA
jgi:hypothetical protein